DIDARIRVVGPVDRDLVDAHAGALREDQKLGIEEPRLILNGGDEPTRRDGRDRFESALRIAELGAEPEVEQEVVRARDELALRSATHTRASRQPAPDREVAVAGHEWRDEWKERVEVRRQVDVHVRHDRRLASEPGGAQ